MSAHKTYENVPVHVRHVLDESVPEKDEHGRDQRVTSGFLDIGVIVDGAFVRLARIKAAGALADIARAKAEAAKSEAAPE